MRVPLRIGVCSEKTAWKNRVLWLLDDEFGFPCESIEGLKQLPLLVFSYAKFVQNSDRITNYLSDFGSTVIVCTSSDKKENEVKKCDTLSVEFGKQQYIKGAITPVNAHDLSQFFPNRMVWSKRRKDFLLETRITPVKLLSSAAKAVFSFKTLESLEYPLLVCGKTRSDRRFALITADENFLDFKNSYLPALVYLASVEWCLEDKPFVRKWHWPSKKRLAIALTFDFETLSLYRRGRKLPGFCWWNHRLDYMLLGLGIKRILPFLSKRKIPSTWFVLGSQAIRTPALIGKLASNDLIDFEGHGDFHQRIDKNAKNFDRETENVQQERLERMLKMLDKVSSEKMRGFRAPGLYANLETLYALEKVGFRWDSSASPQTNYPIRWFFLPHSLILDWNSMETQNLVEIPVTEPWDGWCPIHGSFHTPSDYLDELFEDFAFMYRIGGMQVLLIHPYEIAAKYRWWNAIKTFVETVRKFESVTLQTCDAIYEHWVKRMRLKIDAAYETESKTIIIETKKETPELTLLVYPLKGQEVKLEMLSQSGYMLERNWRDVCTLTFKGKS